MTYHQPVAAAPQVAKLTARDFWLLADAGAFQDYVRTELIEGEIWFVNAVHSWHAKVMARVSRALGNALEAMGSPLEIYLPVSVDMSEHDVPEPDISIGEPHDDGPLPLSKLRLAVEITDTSEKMDLLVKPRLYARHGVPEYWVIHRGGGCAIRHTDPRADGYARQDEIKFGQRVESLTIEGIAIETADLR